MTALPGRIKFIMSSWDGVFALLFAESLFTAPISSQWPQCFEIGSCIGRLATFVTFLTRQPASLTWAECWCQEVARQEVV